MHLCTHTLSSSFFFFPSLTFPSISMRWLLSCYLGHLSPMVGLERYNNNNNTTTTMSLFPFISYAMTNGYRALSARPHFFCLPLCKSSLFPPKLSFALPSPGLPHRTSYVSLPLYLLTEDRNQKQERVREKKIKLLFLVVVNYHWTPFFLSLI